MAGFHRVKEADVKKLHKILDEAVARGKMYAEQCDVVLTEGKFDDPYSRKRYPGFPRHGKAYVRIKPGTIKMARWLKSEDVAVPTEETSGGVLMEIHGYENSYDQRMAHAKGVADVFQMFGIDATVEGTLLS